MKRIFTTAGSLYCLLGMLAMLTEAAAQAQSSLPGIPANIDTPGLSIDSVIRYRQARLSPADTGEGGGLAQLAEFARTWKDRVTVNDSSGINMFGQYYMASRNAAAARLATGCAGGGAFTGNWTCIGPDSLLSQNLGRVTNLWVCPDDTNFLLATSAGGLFKSTDAGLRWACITDNTPVSKGIVSPTSIAVSPIDTQFIYLGSGSYVWHVKAMEGLLYDLDDYGNGLLYTTNGGATWQQEILPLHIPRTWKDSLTGAGVLFAPDGGRLYATMAGELFFKIVGSSWQYVTLPSWLASGPYNWWDVQFVPNGITTLDANHFFISATGQDQLFEVTYDPVNQSHTWTSIPLPDIGGPISFTIPTADMLYAIRNDHRLWRYDIAGKTWSFVASVPLIGGFQYACHDTACARIWQIAASKANPAIIYFAQEFNIAHVSNDTGHTTVPICYYGGNPTHTDIRTIQIHTATNTTTGIGDRVYFANDGGVSLKRPGVNPIVAREDALQNINGKGLACGRFLGVGTSELNGGVLASQADNSFCSYEPKASPQWYQLGGGDGEEAVIVRTSDTGYTGISGGGPSNQLRIVFPANGRQLGDEVWAGTLNIKVEPHSGLIPMWPDQQGGVYHGQTHMWRSLPHDNNTDLVSGPNIKPQFAPYEIHLPEYYIPNTNNQPPIKCMSFSQYLDSLTGYVMYEDGALFYRNYYASPSQNIFGQKTTTWFASFWPPTGIVCDPSHPEQVWVSLGGVAPTDTARYRVMYSPDAAQHWFDISKGLPRKLPVTQIVYQEGSPFVYCSTDVGMYKLDMSNFQYSSLSDGMSAYNSVSWTCFNQVRPRLVRLSHGQGIRP